MKPDFYLLTEHIKIIVFSPFCSICVIFVILIRIYRMGKYTRASAHVEGSARNQGKTSILVQRHSIPGQSLQAGSAVPLPEIL